VAASGAIINVKAAKIISSINIGSGMARYLAWRSGRPLNEMA